MAAANKIIKYELGEKTLELAASCTTMEIARILTEEIQKKGVTDSVSQPSVARFIKAHRDERANQTKALVQSYVQGTTPRDLQILDDVMLGHYHIYKNLKPDPENPEKLIPGEYSFEQCSSAGMKAVRVIETKLRWSGALSDKDPEDAAADAAKKIQDDLETDLMEKIDVVGSA